jgi:hypothetical protein
VISAGTPHVVLFSSALTQICAIVSCPVREDGSQSFVDMLFSFYLVWLIVTRGCFYVPQRCFFSAEKLPFGLSGHFFRAEKLLFGTCLKKCVNDH